MLTQILHNWTQSLQKNGTLTILTLLLSELVLVLWFSFFALFAFEMLLPTFVLARLSLAQYFFWLLIVTVATLKLRQMTSMSHFDLPGTLWRPALVLGWLFVLVLTILSLVHFSLVGGIIFFIFYTILSWFLWQLTFKK